LAKIGLKEQIRQLKQQVLISQQQSAILQEELTKERQTRKNQKQQLDQLLRQHCGRKSERVSPDQPWLDPIMIEALEQAQQEISDDDDLITEDDVEPEPKPSTQKSKKRRGRKPLPPHLERCIIELDLPEGEKYCPKNGRELVLIGHDEVERLEYIPAVYRVNVYRRPKYVSPDPACSDVGVLTAALPEGPIDRCKAEVSTLAHVLVSKYVNHLPLYRQQQILKWAGVKLSRSTLSGWVLGCAEALEPLYDALIADILENPIIGTDDTSVKMLSPGKGKTVTARLWVYRAGIGSQHRAFDFSTNRKNTHPNDFLKNYSGYVQADAYSGYDQLFSREDVTEVGCWAHARRKFEQALDHSPVEAPRALAYIRAMYMIERKAREQELDAKATQRLREAHSRPYLTAFFAEMEKWQRTMLPKSTLATAVTYVMNQKVALHQYLNDGQLNIDNNLTENAVRAIAVGRKNWLFAGSERGGWAAAIIYSFIESCRAAQIEPYEYLEDVLTRINTHPASRINELLPEEWQRLRQKPANVLVA